MPRVSTTARIPCPREFVDEPRDVGIATHFKVRGGFELALYQPHYTR